MAETIRGTCRARSHRHCGRHQLAGGVEDQRFSGSIGFVGGPQPRLQHRQVGHGRRRVAIPNPNGVVSAHRHRQRAGVGKLQIQHLRDAMCAARYFTFSWPAFGDRTVGRKRRTRMATCGKVLMSLNLFRSVSVFGIGPMPSTRVDPEMPIAAEWCLSEQDSCLIETFPLLCDFRLLSLNRALLDLNATQFGVFQANLSTF